jgi:hypothetical protein
VIVLGSLTSAEVFDDEEAADPHPIRKEDMRIAKKANTVIFFTFYAPLNFERVILH